MAVIRDAHKVLNAALVLAEKENKKIAKIGLMKTFGSINYTDIDNTFLEQTPDYIISRHGLYSFPRFSRIFSLLFIEDELLEKLPASEAQRVKRHQEYFSGHTHLDGNNHETIWNDEKILNSFMYIFSGKARSEFIELLHIISKVKDISFIPPDIDIWSGDNGLISVKFDAMDLFREKTLRFSLVLNFFQPPEECNTANSDAYHTTAHSLTGIQLWRTFLGGRDGTWR